MSWHMTASRHFDATRARFRRGLGLVLLAAGILLVAEGVVTVVWQEPFSALSAHNEQGRLDNRLRALEAEALASPTGYVARGRNDRTALLARRYERRTHPGDPLGRIAISRLHVHYVFVAGVAAAQLSKGPGHYPGTALPGQHGTVGIAGHRTTYLAPFRHIDELRRGDSITIRMPYGRFRYAVEGKTVVLPSNTRPLRRARHDRLTLTTCNPPFSAAQRLIVTARLESSRLASGPAASRTRRPL